MTTDTRGGSAPAGRPPLSVQQNAAFPTDSTPGTAAAVLRVRYRAPWWLPTTATAVRIYTRPRDAFAAVERLRNAGYTAELAHAHREPWRLVSVAPWSTGERGELVR